MITIKSTLPLVVILVMLMSLDARPECDSIEYLTDINTGDAALGIFVRGNRLYVADRGSGFKVMNIKDANKLVLMGSYLEQGRSQAQDVFVSRSLAYVAEGGRGFSIIDVADPYNPSLVRYVSNPGLSGAYTDVYVSGDYAYFAHTPRGLLIFNISKLSKPKLVGEFKVRKAEVADVFVRGRYAYLAVTSHQNPSGTGLLIIDVTNPSNPLLVNSLKTPGQALNLFIADDYAYIADLSGGLQIVDISNSWNPRTVGTWEGGSVANVCVYSNIANAVDRYKNRVYAIDVRNPTSPHLISQCRIYGGANIEGRTAQTCDIGVKDEYIYVANWRKINILKCVPKEKALKKGLKISLEIAPESALISQIKRLFGDLYLATNKYKLADKYTKEALVVAEKIGEKVEIAACYRIFAQLEHRNDNDNKSAQADKAKEYYTKAIDLFKLIGSRYELAVTQYLAATSGLYHNGVRHAMLYMTRDYFESENVKPYLKKIEKALKNPTTKEKLKPIASGAPTIIAVNPQMKKLVEIAENVAQSDMSVLLTGETGTGKDLIASYIHHASCREGDFVEFNCPLFSDGLFESELFGSVKGAFTSANKDRVGRVELANNGTLFLNEISEIPVQQQAKLLRVIETGEYEKVGSSKKLKTNCRIIVATNVDLKQRISDGKFRADLYHRINEIPYSSTTSV